MPKQIRGHHSTKASGKPKASHMRPEATDIKSRIRKGKRKPYPATETPELENRIEL